jgi:NAD-dependent deacetylase
MTNSVSTTLSLTELVERAANIIRHARYALAFTGAGISTPSGIPDFRNPNSGIWHEVNPLEVASIGGFRRNPTAFFQWIRSLARHINRAHPNPAHVALAQMEALGYLQGVITQNIDMLHSRAGTRTLYELHGHLREATCIRCFAIYPAQPIIEKFLDDGYVPHCSACGGVLKPNVILYGEQLPMKDFIGAKIAARQADAIMVIGSSLAVAPASDIPILAARNQAKLIVVNWEPTFIDPIADVVIHANVADILPQIMCRLEAFS